MEEQVQCALESQGRVGVELQEDAGFAESSNGRQVGPGTHVTVLVGKGRYGHATARQEIAA